MTLDKNLIRRRFEANFARYDALARVQEQICDQLDVMLAPHIEGGIRRACEVGIGTGFLTRRLAGRFPDAEWFLNDLSPAAQEFTDRRIAGCSVSYFWGDAEAVPLPGELDLVASASTVQWFDDLPAFVGKAAAATRPGGWLALSTFGPGNFAEIRELTGRGLDYFDREGIGAILAARGYRTLAVESYCRTLWFDTPVEVLRHIRATGVNSLGGEPWTKSRMAEFEGSYIRLYGREGRVPLTYHPVLVVARKEI